jgi:hypothetical protein
MVEFGSECVNVIIHFYGIKEIFSGYETRFHDVFVDILAYQSCIKSFPVFALCCFIV